MDDLKLGKIGTIACDTSILVIIGYTFPFFNRAIDRKVIGAMTKLDRVYIQDIEPEKVRDTFFSIRSDLPENKIKLIKNCDQFFLPPEL